VNLKNITLGICVVGVVLMLAGIVTGNSGLAAGGVMLAGTFGILRGLLSVTKLF
jgi:hypothetical protein